MCRNIKTLHNFEPPATEAEIRASALQFVRKLSGFARPSKANAPAFDRAVERVAQAAHELLDSLVTNAPPRDREVEASKARARGRRRGGGGASPRGAPRRARGGGPKTPPGGARAGRRGAGARPPPGGGGGRGRGGAAPPGAQQGGPPAEPLDQRGKQRGLRQL